VGCSPGGVVQQMMEIDLKGAARCEQGAHILLLLVLLLGESGVAVLGSWALISEHHCCVCCNSNLPSVSAGQAARTAALVCGAWLQVPRWLNGRGIRGSLTVSNGPRGS